MRVAYDQARFKHPLLSLIGGGHKYKNKKDAEDEATTPAARARLAAGAPAAAAATFRGAAR